MSCAASGCWSGANSMRQARRAAWWLQVSSDGVLLLSQECSALSDLVLWLLGSSLLFDVLLQVSRCQEVLIFTWSIAGVQAATRW